MSKSLPFSLSRKKTADIVKNPPSLDNRDLEPSSVLLEDSEVVKGDIVIPPSRIYPKTRQSHKRSLVKPKIIDIRPASSTKDLPNGNPGSQLRTTNSGSVQKNMLKDTESRLVLITQENQSQKSTKKKKVYCSFFSPSHNFGEQSVADTQEVRTKTVDQTSQLTGSINGATPENRMANERILEASHKSTKSR